MQLVQNDINNIYRELCKGLIVNGNTVNDTKELNNVQFTLTNIANNVVGVRDISKSYLFGELVWYFNGRNDVKFISKFASLWERITDDGVTSNSAYGDIIFKRYGFNQVEKVIELLKKDRNSRRAVINFNVPNEQVIETKDEICTICLQFMIRNKKLYCTAVMRSNDIWFGLPYDVVFFTELQKYIADRVGVSYGTYTHFTGSLHVYDRFLDNIKNASVTEPKSRIRIVNIHRVIQFAKSIARDVEKAEDPKKEVIRLFKDYGLCEEVPYEN